MRTTLGVDMGQSLTDDEIFARIDVVPPYFALSELEETGPNSISAIAPIEQPRGAEAGPMAAAEAGRHLAIAGSVAASRLNERSGRFHYLAFDAEYRRARSRVPSDIDRISVRADARVVSDDTMHAAVLATTVDGEPVCSLSVYYLVVGYDDLRALFADHAVPTPTTDRNPYLEMVRPERIDIDGHRIEVDLGRVAAESCAGHFDGLPAMPVAYLMANVCRTIDELLRVRLDDPDLTYTLREGSVRADALAFAGERVVLRGEHQGEHLGTEWVYLEAFADGDKRVGAVHAKTRVRRAV